MSNELLFQKKSSSRTSIIMLYQITTKNFLKQVLITFFERLNKMTSNTDTFYLKIAILPKKSTEDKFY